MKYFVTLILILNFLIITPSFSLPNLENETNLIISEKEEYMIGKYWMGQIRKDIHIFPDLFVNEYIQQLGNKLTINSGINKKTQFFVLDNLDVNAFTFLGGFVATHSGIILLTKSESELASILAHELAHIKQQHILQQILDQKRKLPLTIAGSLTSVLIGAPDLIFPIMAGHQQYSLNFSRKHEKEADRIGMDILTKANFNPNAMPEIFERMSLNNRYHERPLEYLITHPLYESRVADCKNRAYQLPYKQTKDSILYNIIKSRIEIFYEKNILNYINKINFNINNKKYNNLDLEKYKLSQAYIKINNINKAIEILQSIELKNNLYIKLSLAESYMKNKNYSESINLLNSIKDSFPNNPTFLLLLAENYFYMNNLNSAKNILIKFNKIYPDEPYAYQLLIKTYLKLDNKLEYHLANSKWHLLHSDFPTAIRQIDLAILNTNNNEKIKALKKERENLNKLLKEFK